MVDTGAENVLAADWLADLAGVDLQTNSDVSLIGIGGQTAEVRFVEVELRLHRPDAGDQVVSWRCDVGFVPGWQAPFALVLGQAGFLDRFTVTFHRGAAMLAIESGRPSTPASVPAGLLTQVSRLRSVVIRIDERGLRQVGPLHAASASAQRPRRTAR